MITINIILGSSRKASLGKNLFNYLKSNQNYYEQITNANINFLAISDYQIPFFYEDVPPIQNKDRKLPKNQQQWLNDMEKANGYVFLTPEYNHSIPAVLKNAIDYLANQISNKASLIMTYSNNNRGGQFSGSALMPILTRLNTLVLPQIVSISNVQDTFKKDGNLVENSSSKNYYQKKLKQTIQKIVFYSRLFKENPFKK